MNVCATAEQVDSTSQLLDWFKAFNDVPAPTTFLRMLRMQQLRKEGRMDELREMQALYGDLLEGIED